MPPKFVILQTTHIIMCLKFIHTDSYVSLESSYVQHDRIICVPKGRIKKKEEVCMRESITIISKVCVLQSKPIQSTGWLDY